MTLEAETTTTISDATRYNAWGETLAATGSATNPWGYQGRLDVGADAANPLYDFGFRDYSPELGSFTELDTLTGSPVDPLSFNRYLYAEANPATLVDPTGHFVPTVGESYRKPARQSITQVIVASQQKKAEQILTAQDAKASVAAEDNTVPSDVEVTNYDWCSPFAGIVQALLSGCTFRPNQFQAYSLLLQLPPGLGDAYQAYVIKSGCDPVANVCLSDQEREDAAFAAWLTLGLIPATAGRDARAVGFASGEGISALVPDRLQHATFKLEEAGLLPTWSGTKSPSLIADLVSPILETPILTFDNVLRGRTPVKGFLGYTGGKYVVVYVSKDAADAGQLVSAWVPSASQLQLLGVSPR